MQRHQQDWSEFLSSSVIALSINEHPENSTSLTSSNNAEFSFNSCGEQASTWTPLGKRSFSTPPLQTKPIASDSIWITTQKNKEPNNQQAHINETRESTNSQWNSISTPLNVDAHQYIPLERNQYNSKSSTLHGNHIRDTSDPKLPVYPLLRKSKDVMNYGFYSGISSNHQLRANSAVVMPMHLPLYMHTGLNGMEMDVHMGLRVVPRNYIPSSNLSHESGRATSFSPSLKNSSLGVDGYFGKPLYDPRRSKSVDFKHSQLNMERVNPILASYPSNTEFHSKCSPQNTSSRTAHNRIDENMHLRTFYEVEFKRYRKEIFMGKSDFVVGEFVKVEADRGEDLGKILQVIQGIEELRRVLFTMEKNDASFKSPKKIDILMKRVIGVATEGEMLLAKHKALEEEEVLEICRNKVRQRLLPMHVIDAEFQFDRHKLTFFFEAERRIDFRELVRDLFSIYKTRIWLQQIVSIDKKKEEVEVRENF